MTTLVGSTAAQLAWPNFRGPAADLDYFTNHELPKSMHGKRVERFWHDDLEKWDWGTVANGDELYTLKVSHMFWDNRWVKHAKDIIWIQENTDAKFLPALYDILYSIWVEHYGRKRASLPKGTKDEEFFTAAVDRKYDHDSIHASVAYGERPLFNEVLQDGESVAVSWKKFEALDFETQLRLCREEVYATALERRVIPAEYNCNPLVAYRWALQQTITSFWKGRWALFMVLNLKDLQKPDIDYVQKHRDNERKLILL